jgi:hypothetical protein
MHDLKAMELETAKAILAEVFRVRLSEVDEMILKRFRDDSSQEACYEKGEPWPQEFRLGE